MRIFFYVNSRDKKFHLMPSSTYIFLFLFPKRFPKGSLFVRRYNNILMGTVEIATGLIWSTYRQEYHKNQSNVTVWNRGQFFFHHTLCFQNKDDFFWWLCLQLKMSSIHLIVLQENFQQTFPNADKDFDFQEYGSCNQKDLFFVKLMFFASNPPL